MNSPFKFLDSYTIDDRDIFFGREKEIEDLYRRVFESKLLLVYGNSGTGKSSLIQCGLGSYLGNTDWLPLYIRRGTNIIQSIDDTIRKSAVTPIRFQNDTPANFVRSVHSVYLDHFRPVFFIFDQFEELFIFGSAEEKEAFISIIKAFILSDLQCRIIVILREEYLAGATEFEKEIPTFFSNRMRIERISRANAKLAIEGPCTTFGIDIENDFADNLLERLSPEGSEIELTYLQLLLDRLYRLSVNLDNTDNNSEKSVRFTNDLLGRVGNVGDLLRDFLDEQISRLENPDSAISVLKSFVSLQGTRRQMGIAEIKDYTEMVGKPLEEEAIKELIQTFINLRFLTDKDSYNRYELRHDTLAGKIHEKITLIEKEILEVQTFIENAYKSFQNRGNFLSKDDFRYISPYEDRMYLKRPLREFLDKSRQTIQRAAKRKLLIAGITVFTILILLSCLSVWALKERNIANRLTKITQSDELASLCLLGREDPTLSLRLALTSYDEYTGLLSREALSYAYESATFNPMYYILKGHQSRVYTFDYTLLNNGRIVTASADSTARIWDLYGNELYVLKGHREPLYSVDISSDGRYILTASTDSSLRIWDMNGRLVKTIKDENEWNYIAKFSQDPHYIVSASISGNGTIWQFDENMRSVEKTCYLKGHNKAINFIGFSSDNKYIVTTSKDSAARVWNFDGKNAAILEGHTELVRYADFSPDNSRIVTSSDDGTARIWDLHGNMIKVLSDHTGGVNRSMYSPDGTFIATVSNDGSLIVYDLNGQKLITYNPDLGSVDRVDISHDSKFIAIGTSDGIAQIIDRKGNLLYELKRHNGSIWELKFTGNTTQIITVSEDGLGKIWTLQPQSGVTIRDIQIKKVIYYNPAISSDKLIALSNGNILSTLDLSNNFRNEIKYNSTGINAVFSPDMKYILTSSDDKTARLWTTDGQQLKELKHSHEVTSAIFSPDNKTILTSSSNGVVRLWNLDGQLLNEFQYEIETINYASFSNDGKYILVCSRNKRVFLFTIAGDLITEFEEHGSSVNCARFSPDDSLIVSGSSDGEVKLWTKDGIEISFLKSHRTAIDDIGFSSDGQYFYTLSRNPYLIKIWDIRGRLLNIINLGESVGKEHYAAFFKGSLMVLTSANNRLYIKSWPVRSEDILHNINQDSTLGKIRPLTDKELIEYNFKY